MSIKKINWAQKLAAEFTARNNDTNSAWSSAICTSPVWDEETEEYVGPFLASAYDGQVVLDQTLCCGDLSNYHEGMTVYFTGNPFNGNKVLVQAANSGGSGTTYTAGNGIEISDGQISSKVDNDTLLFDDSGTMYADLSGKQDVLTAGTGIDITNNVISASGEFTAGQIGSELTDMNNITTCKFYGIYRNLSQVSHVPSNVPTSTAYYSLLVAPSHNNVNRIVQVLVFEPPNTSTSSEMWFRTRMNETTPTWTSWYQINTSTTEDIPDWNNTIDLYTLFEEEDEQ